MLLGVVLLCSLALHLAECGSPLGSLQWPVKEAMQLSHRTPQLHMSLSVFKAFCATRQDGVYPDLTTGCSVYYRCLEGATYSYWCPPRNKMDQSGEECRPESEVSCPRLPPASPPCINQSDGYYPDFSHDCRSYYRCTNASMSGKWWCEDGAVWDSATGSCKTGQQFQGCFPPSCMGLPDGTHPTPASSCTSYFTCNDGIRTDHVCPYSTIFDYKLKRCVPSSTSVCYEEACEGRINGLYAAPHAPCNAYFRCFNGALNLTECPPHQVFDGTGCTSANNFTCWGEGQGTCEGREDGLYSAAGSECRGFFMCRHQQFIRSFLCSPGLVFNGVECVDEQNSICTSRPRLPDCSTKIDGYYTVEKTGCKTFLHCRGGSKLSEHTCPGINVFNGEQCVDPMLFRCPARTNSQHRNFTNRVIRSRSIRDPDCKARTDGYYLDQTSNCTRFFHCRSGTKKTHTCPPNKKFNGVQCIPEVEFECPVIPDDRECALRGDGVYQNLKDSCASYYRCSAGVKTKYRCPEGELHDGDICRSASKVHCPSVQGRGPQEKDCAHNKKGLFQDLASGCTRFYFCYNGRRVYQQCPGGKVFNGRTCVAKDLYSCPHLSDREKHRFSNPA